MYKQISSIQNPLIKQIALLIDKSRERKKNRLFVIEGKREIMLALKGGYYVQTLLFTAEIFTENITDFCSEETEIVQITSEVYQKLAYRTTTEGLLALVETKAHTIENLNLTTKNPLILIAEAPEKPGNIGALLRTADAAQVDAVIIANPKTDLYNPNIIRSSIGCLFSNTVVTGSTDQIISFLTQHKIHIYSAILQEAVPYHSCDFTQATAIVVGTEATGLSEAWRKASDQNIIIPMQGEIDSMNVSVAAGIIIFEAKRQRNFK